MIKRIENLIGRGRYEAPSVDILDVQSEGVLCESGIGINDWQEDDELLDFD